MGTRTAVVASVRQRGNPLLSRLVSHAVTYSADLVPDYHISTGIGALFLSVRYHLLHPGYLADRLRRCAADREVHARTVAVCLADAPGADAALEDITCMCLDRGVALLVATSYDEAARFIEALRHLAVSGATLDAIKGPKDASQAEVVTSFLTTGACEGVFSLHMWFWDIPETCARSWGSVIIEFVTPTPCTRSKKKIKFDFHYLLFCPQSAASTRPMPRRSAGHFRRCARC
jgi:DNA repair protein Rad10